MTDLVLSLHQPWASLLFAINHETGRPFKTFETRGGPPNGDMRPEGVRAGIGGHKLNRGDRLWIASTVRTPPPTGFQGQSLAGGRIGFSRLRYSDHVDDAYTWQAPGGRLVSLPIGMMLGSVQVVDAYEMADESGLTSTPGRHGLVAINLRWRSLTGLTWVNTVSPGRYIDKDLSERLHGQLPYGDWQPGRWAIELADPVILDTLIPVKGRQGIWEWKRDT